MWRCARLLGRDPVKAIVLVGLNPIVLVWGLGGDHNDFLMLLAIVLGFYLLLRARAADGRRAPRGRCAAPSATRSAAAAAVIATRMGAGAAFITAAAFKASGGMLIPIVLAGLVRDAAARSWQVMLGMVVAASVLGVASLVAFGLHVPDLSTQRRLVTMRQRAQPASGSRSAPAARPKRCARC